MQNVFDARAMIQKGLVIGIDDTGEAQTATVRTTDGATYSGIEVYQPFGAASVPPGDGAIAILFSIGGDPANMVALLANPSIRFGNQAQGESVQYGPDGTRVSVRAGGLVEIVAATQVTINAPDVTINATGSVTIAAAGGVTLGTNATVQGNLQVNGNINATGTIHG